MWWAEPGLLSKMHIKPNLLPHLTRNHWWDFNKQICIHLLLCMYLILHKVGNLLCLFLTCLFIKLKIYHKHSIWGEVSVVAQMVKNLPANQETCVWSLSRDEPLEKEYVHFPFNWVMPTFSYPLTHVLNSRKSVGRIKCYRVLLNSVNS